MARKIADLAESYDIQSTLWGSIATPPQTDDGVTSFHPCISNLPAHQLALPNWDDQRVHTLIVQCAVEHRL